MSANLFASLYGHGRNHERLEPFLRDPKFKGR
jgi:hypothetical protein